MLLTEEELKNEVWVDIKGYEGLYMVSNMGRIKNKKNNIMILMIKNGYCNILLYKNTIRKYLRVHRIVATHFIKNIYNKPYVNHLNNDRKDNRAVNLEWCTPKENSQHAALTGRLVGYKNKYNLKNLLIDIKKIYETELIKPLIYNNISYNRRYSISSYGYIISHSKYRTKDIILNNRNYLIYYDSKVISVALFTALKENFLPDEKMVFFKNELWKPLDIDLNYSVSNYGRIISNKTKKIIKQHISNGYYRIELSKRKKYYVHFLVASSFIVNPDISKKVINHIDGDKLNNNSSNLEWVTNKENAQHYQDNLAINLYGNEKRKSSKLNAEKIIEIFYDTTSHTTIAKKYNISRRHVGFIKNKNRWKHITADL